MLQLVANDWDLNLRATSHPEFDAWRWNDYWVPLDVVVEFKRGVYEMALTELARFLPRSEYRNRCLRGGMRPREGGTLPAIQTLEQRERGPGVPVRHAGHHSGPNGHSAGLPSGKEAES